METFTRRILDAPEWQPYRSSVLDAHGRTCTHCGISATRPYIQPKRYVPGWLPWDYEIEEMQVVCYECYYAVHNFTEELFRLLNKFHVEDQDLLLSLVEDVCRLPAAARQVGAQHAYSHVKYTLNEAKPEPSNPNLEGRKTDAGNQLLSFDPSTVTPLVDTLDSLLKVPLRQQIQVIFHLMQSGVLT